jgi:hypothetical protein
MTAERPGRLKKQDVALGSPVRSSFFSATRGPREASALLAGKDGRHAPIASVAGAVPVGLCREDGYLVARLLCGFALHRTEKWNPLSEKSDAMTT